MVLFDRGQNKGDRSLDRRWHEVGRIAKTRTDGLEDWGDIDIAKYDLDAPEREPTGVENPRTWRYDPPLRETNVPDDRQRGQRDLRDSPRN